MVQPPDDYSMRRKFINGLPLSLAEGVVKARGISAEHSAMEQILAEVQKMESALKMISNHSRTQAVKSSFRGTGTGVPVKEKSSPENSGNGHKYFHRGNVLYKKALSNVRQQRTDGQRPGTRDAGRGTYNRGGGASGKGRGTLSRKDAGCFNCGEVGHFADHCPKPKKQNKARLFAVDVQEPDTAEDTGEQDNTAHGVMDDQDPSPESDDEGDPVDGPQYPSDEGDIVDIYDDDGDSDGEPVACLRRMYTHDPRDEEIVYCSSMTARDGMDVCIEWYEADSDDESAREEAQTAAPVPALANVEPHENGYHRDNINDLLEVPAPGQGHEHVDAPVNVAANRGIGNWGVINTMENIAMPATNTNPQWEWDERFGFSHHGECLTCCLYRRHVIASELEEDPGLEAARAFPS